ncbi:MAG TPA: adenylate kinase [Candidatus Marinimicrobia bacterium]|nr:adenylate kinase [Candidatus Neomarinimicrobiota bacterium]HIN03328.1 adenylate kinase [Candidatus Neomarinimicrobiota bacterium]
MKLLIMGPPGVGKGTQADRIKDKLKILHLSTGDILRAEVEAKSAIGVDAKLYMDFGKLVPDHILIEIVKERISKDDCENGYLLDGFPRTLPQAEGLDEMMHSIGHDLECAISLTADEDELVERLIKRGKESGRSDDTPEVIRNRQKIYWEQTAPLLDFYRGKGILKEVDGSGEIPEITERILDVLK